MTNIIQIKNICDAFADKTNLFFFGKLQGITFSAFLDQYIFYAQTIGSGRFMNLIFTFQNIIGRFLLIYLILSVFFYINFKKIFLEKNYVKQDDFYIFLILVSFTFSLILHQLLTKNQTFIFFIIPILCAFSQISISNSKLRFKKIIYLIILSICLFSTIKYYYKILKF